MLQPKIGEYQGKPTLILNPDQKFPFSFGLGKARMIIDHYEAIVEFVKSDGESITPCETELSEDADKFIDAH